MPVTDPTIAAAIDQLKSISPVGGFTIESILIREIRLWPEIAAHLNGSTARTIFYRNCQSTSRAWLLIKLCTDFWAGEGVGPAPNRNEMTRASQILHANSEAYLRNEIRTKFDPDATLRLIEARSLDRSRTVWDNAFSDPERHDENNFIYLIHAMRATTGIGVDTATHPKRAAYLRRRLEGFLDRKSVQTETLELHSASLYLSRPEILTTEVLSCSVIRNNHVKTYGSFVFGYILSVPGINIIAASPRDISASAVQNMARGDQLANLSCEDESKVGYLKMGLLNDFYRKLGERFEDHLQTPNQIVNASGGHNEILVLGRSLSPRSATSVVRPAAIFVKTNRHGKICKSFFRMEIEWGLGRLMAQCSRSLNIPIVPIPDDAEPPSHIDFALWRETAYGLPR